MDTWVVSMSLAIVNNAVMNMWGTDMKLISFPLGIHPEKGMATHSSILAWRIPWTEEPGGLQSMALQRVRYDLATKQQQQIMASPPLPESLLNIYNCSVPAAVTSQ